MLPAEKPLELPPHLGRCAWMRPSATACTYPAPLCDLVRVAAAVRAHAGAARLHREVSAT